MAESKQGSRAISCLRYRNAPAAIDWLCSVLGFERQLVVPGPNGTIAHAQLSLGPGLIMLGSQVEDAFGKYMCQPDETGGRETQSVYLVVPDADVIFHRVKTSGGVIVYDIRDEDYGGRGFSFQDPQGRLWSVGTYDPWSSPH